MASKEFRSMYDVVKEDFKPNAEMDHRSVMGMCRTWDVIAYDCLVDDNGRPDESKTMRRSEVIEMVLDSDFMTTYSNEPLEVCAYTICMMRHYPTHWKRLVKRAFPYRTYGY